MNNNENKPYTLGVLTSGGDAPGMNAAVRAVVRTALFNKMAVKGIFKGYDGLMNGNFIDMNLRSVSGILERGGTILYSARSPGFNTPEGVAHAKDMCVKHGIDGLVVCGGDGSFRGARDLSLAGIPCVGVPCTIDNDISSTDYAIGYDTALNTVIQAVDRLRDTTESHDRCSVVEVMGRHCGDLALQAAICCGAVSVLVPELKHKLERDVIEKMRDTLKMRKSHFIIIVAEGVTGMRFGKDETMNAAQLASYIEENTGVETRATVLGHVQRGGSPTARDRVLASKLGHYAVELLREGKGNRVVAEHRDRIVDYDIFEALNQKKKIDKRLVRLANEISI